LRASRQQEAAYRRVWQAFRSYDHVADGRHDTEDWRSHPGIWAGVIVRVPADTLQPSLDELRDALHTYPYIRIHPDPFLHIMLQELGFDCEKPDRRDEITPARLDEFIEAASQALAEAPAFDIRLTGANAFQDAVFLDVQDRGHCARLHTRLRELAAVPTVPKYAYLPHTTIAHFTADAPIDHLPGLIAQWRDRRFGEFAVTEIEVITLRLDEPYPALESYATFPLVT
jgi:2'-5' RNA ligase